MKKIKPQKILAGGILSLSLLLTAVQGHAKDPAASSGGDGSLSYTGSTITSDPVLASSYSSTPSPSKESVDVGGSISVSSSTYTTTPTITSSASVTSRPAPAALGAPEIYLTYSCVKEYEVDELKQECLDMGDCSYDMTPTDELGNKYFLVKMKFPYSQCTAENNGMVSFVMDSSRSDATVMCSFVKEFCRY